MSFARTACLGLLFCCQLLVAEEKKAPPRPEKPTRSEPEATPKFVAPTKNVKRALREYLSGNPKRERQALHLLKTMGESVLPQIRYSIRDLRSQLSRLHLLLAQLESKKERRAFYSTLAVNDYFFGKAQEARDLNDEGKFRESLKIMEALLALDPDSQYAWQWHRLLRRTRERLASKELLEPLFEVNRIVYEVEERPEIMFRLTNRGRRAIRIALDRGVLGEVDMTVDRHSVDGSGRSDRRKLQVKVDENVEEIVIGPGKTWERVVEFDPGTAIPLANVVARVRLSGRFRPARWEAGDTNENLSLKVPRTEFWIVPPSQKRLGDKPLQKMTAALLFGKMESFFVGGQLAVWAGEVDARFNRRLVETLISHLEGLDAARLQVATRLLRQATGLRFEAAAKPWVEWWSRRKSKSS